MNQQTETPKETPVVPDAGMWDKFKAALGLSNEQIETGKAVFSGTKSAREIELEAELKAVKAAQFSGVAQANKARAQTEGETLLKVGRIKPHELSGVVAEFARALDDDAKHPAVVTFSTDVETTSADGKVMLQEKPVEMGRADRLKAIFSRLPVVDVTKEQIREFPPETQVAFSQEASKLRNAPDDGKVDAAAYEQYVGKPLAAK